MPIVKLKDVVKRVKEKVDKDNTELEYYVGGEHIDSGEISIIRKGIIEGSTIGPAFHMHFMPGDVLLMSRNPHLKKAGVVDFEGICSDVSYICRTKDETVLLQRYLPFIFQTEHFWKFVEENKKGGLPFFLNWSDFERYEFDLPTLPEQQKLADLLWAAQNTKLAYLELLKQTDALVKSQFIEMFGDADDCRFEVSTIGDTCKLKSGTTFPADKEQAEGDFLYAKVSDMNLPGNELYIRSSKSRVSAATAGNTPIPAGSVIFPKRGGAIGTNKKRILSDDTCVDLNTMGVIPGERLLTEYLYQFFLNLDLLSLADGSAIPQLNNRQIAPVKIVVPPIDLQKEFKELFQQSDKSKFEIRQAIERINELMKSLMKQ